MTGCCSNRAYREIRIPFMRHTAGFTISIGDARGEAASATIGSEVDRTLQQISAIVHAGCAGYCVSPWPWAPSEFVIGSSVRRAQRTQWPVSLVDRSS